MNSISLTNEELAVLPRTSVCEAPNEFSNGSVMFLTSLSIKICARENISNFRRKNKCFSNCRCYHFSKLIIVSFNRIFHIPGSKRI